MRRPTPGGEDVISMLQATLERQEHRRRILRRSGAGAAALALVLVIAAAVFLHGNASAADRVEAARNAAPAPSTLVTAAALPAAPQREVKAATPTVPVTPKPGSVEQKRRVAKPPVEKLATAKPATSKPRTQRLRIAIGSQGYEPGVVRAESGRPIVLAVGRGEGCAAGFLIPELGVERDNSSGPITVNLGDLPAGKYRFSCGMDMVSGTLIVR